MGSNWNRYCELVYGANLSSREAKIVAFIARKALGWKGKSGGEGVCKKNGQPCTSTVGLEDGYCAVHRPSAGFDPVATDRKGGIKSGEVRREAGKTVRERLREKVEENVEEIWAAFQGAMNATTADGAADHRARYQAAATVLAEAYGKPLQPTRDEGGLIFAHPLLTDADIERLNKQMSNGNG
jgi:hypothetical protein